MHSIDGVAMEDPNSIGSSFSEKSKSYLDRVIALNTEAMGHRDEWDDHGNAILDLVREMAGEMDALRDIIQRRLACDGSNGRYHAVEHFDTTREMKIAAQTRFCCSPSEHGCSCRQQ